MEALSLKIMKHSDRFGIGLKHVIFGSIVWFSFRKRDKRMPWAYSALVGRFENG